MTTTNDLRQMFLDYFLERGHTHVASSPIVPPDDPTILFTVAGMVQFKPLWGGMVEPLPYVRATTVQKCLRASDLESVGKTLRHHTFFEMLGNFSFGDYFKREALEWGWDFVWNRMRLPKDRLWGTHFEEDDEAAELLEKEIGIPRERIIGLDAKENFWGPAGDTGACGPCSEIYFFTGTAAELETAKGQTRGEIARRIVEEGDVFLEIWNMVFPQFDQQKDGSRPRLKYRGIDTGAGLERMTTAMQFIETRGKVLTPYETDLLSPIVAATAEAVGAEYRTVAESGEDYDERKRHWVDAIADHVRALTFALSEGLVPSNEGRGYVLRRILRRALRFAYLLGMNEPFLHRLVEPVVETMGGAYPELGSQPAHVARIIRLEEERFLRTVAQGSRILDEKIGETKEGGGKELGGADVFLLHATYGFPVDMTAEIAEDAGLGLDRAGFDRAMRGHQEEARKSWKGAAVDDEARAFDDVAGAQGETVFRGYDALECEARVLALAGAGERVAAVDEGEACTVVLDETPFYAEAGGQIGDQGAIEGEGFAFAVEDVRKAPNGLYLHHGRVARGEIREGAAVRACVDEPRRLATMRNHTVTHLLQAGLRSVLGAHITQSGSYVGPEGMRFDFSHMQACTPEELGRVERFVNEQIVADLAVGVEEMPIKQARQRGAIAPFGEKYGHHVRVVRIGTSDAEAISMEFCGGTHLDRTAKIGSFRIVAESSVAAGIRRIEGAAGLGAYERWAATRDVAAELCRGLAIKEEQLAERVGALQDEIKRLGRELKRAKQSRSSVPVDELVAGAVVADGIRIVAAKIDDADAGQLRALADQVRDKAPASVCLLGSAAGGKAVLVCAVTKNETARVKAGDVIKRVAPLVGGGGGGRPDLAQAGGKQPEKLDEAIARAPGIIAELIQT